MNFSPNSTSVEPRIDLTPLIDVVFQLLIFFLLTTSFIRHKTIEVELPTADTAAIRVEPNMVLVVTVTRDGRVATGDKVLDIEQVEDLFRQTREYAASRRTEPTVLLRADRAVPHGTVVRVMNRALRQHITRIAIVTRSEE